MSKNPDMVKNRKSENTNQGFWPSPLSARLGYISYRVALWGGPGERSPGMADCGVGKAADECGSRSHVCDWHARIGYRAYTGPIAERY